jgi:hypothetical protein
MKHICLKLLSTISFAIPVFALAPAQAAILNWDVTYFNDNGSRVGSGEFSSNTDSTRVENLFTPTATGGTINVNNFLTNFFANIQGRELKTIRDTSWLDSTAGLRQIENRRGLGRIIASGWDFREGGRPNPFGQLSSFDSRLVLQGNESEANRVWAGNWTLDGSGDSIFSDAKTTGRWQAVVRNTATIAEPTMVFGLMILGGACFLKKDRNSSASFK